MTVWIENPFDNLPQEGFRPQRYFLMARAFAARGHRVVFWTSAFSHMTKRRRAVPDAFAAEDGIVVRLVDAPPYRRNVGLARLRNHRAYARAWLRLARAELAAGRAPDVLVASVPPLSAAGAARALASEAGAFLVADVMDLWPETFARLLPRPLRFLAPLVFSPLFARARRLYREADDVTGVCDAYGRTVRAAGARSYARFYHGLSLSDAPEPDGAAALRLAYFGNLGRTYDLETAIRALARLPEATLEIAGEGERRAALEALAAARAPGRVRFHGCLSGDAARTLLRSCTVGLVPMAPESCVGIPYKMADYADASLAIVSSLGGESETLLARYGAGEAYRPGDAASLAAALGRVRGHLARARAGARRLAECEFDAARLYGDYVAWVCERGNGKGAGNGGRTR